jgi:two-component system chemotaxis response regulator CheB
VPNHDIIVIGASAGGVEALMTVFRGLPADLPAAVFVVLHIPAHAPSVLPKIIERVTPLHVAHAIDGQPIQTGHVYVAVPDHHLLIQQDRVRVLRGPHENLHRPGIDPLFRSAARYYGPRVVGVVLTGALDDGTAGLQAIKTRGGVAVAQDPEEALYASMPRSAITHVAVDHVLPLADIPLRLMQLARQPAADGTTYPLPHGMELETTLMEMEQSTFHAEERSGTPSKFSCPECKGVLYEIDDNNLTRFRCRTGHGYSVETMMAEQADALEQALYVALNTLEENMVMVRRLHNAAVGRGQPLLAKRFATRLQEAEQRADVIRRVLLQENAIGDTQASDDEPTPPTGGLKRTGASAGTS